MTAAHDTTVIHLALKSYPLDAYRRFLESYRRHPAGRPHQLIVALKGFADTADASGHVALLEGLSHETLYVPDEGLDIGSYFYVAERVESQWLVFFNSRSAITADDWLRKLVDAAARPGVGIAGATGSLQSITTDALRRSARRHGPPLWPALRQYLAFLRRLPSFPGFPNPHLRTNAFAVSRTLWLSLRRWPFRRRHDTSIFESGRSSLTRQVLALGCRPVVVDRNGRALTIEEARAIFWSEEQELALATDNQTALYAHGDADMRAFLHDVAWHPLTD